jgi:hypothetical protein
LDSFGLANQVARRSVEPPEQHSHAVLSVLSVAVDPFSQAGARFR